MPVHAMCRGLRVSCSCHANFMYDFRCRKYRVIWDSLKNTWTFFEQQGSFNSVREREAAARWLRHHRKTTELRLRPWRQTEFSELVPHGTRDGEIAVWWPRTRGARPTANRAARCPLSRESVLREKTGVVMCNAQATSRGRANQTRFAWRSGRVSWRENILILVSAASSRSVCIPVTRMTELSGIRKGVRRLQKLLVWSSIISVVSWRQRVEARSSGRPGAVRTETGPFVRACFRSAFCQQ
jgi:hypothetical protein